MRRILLVLTVAALMAAMMVGAGPAKADVSFNGGGTGFGGSSFDVGDDTDGFTNAFFFVQWDSELGDFEPGGVAFS